MASRSESRKVRADAPASMATEPLRRIRRRLEALAAAWEIFSGLLFISAVAPAAFSMPWPAVLFGASIVGSALISPRLLARGERGLLIAAAIRAVSWLVAISPLLTKSDPRLLVAALAFGLMAGGIRRAIYRRGLPASTAPESSTIMSARLRSRIGESAMVAGIIGGHILLLFSVAYLRTQSKVIFRAWWEIVPILALLGTLGFTLAVRPATQGILTALRAGPDASRSVLIRGLGQARRLPNVLASLNFVLWFSCTAVGVFYFRTGPPVWHTADAFMQVAFGSLFAWGVSFYQRGWHQDTIAPTVVRLREWTGQTAPKETSSLRRRMLIDFGIPLVFTTTISLFASIGLYRTLAHDLPPGEDFNAISALLGSFALLVIAGFGVVARAARELSRPLSQVAETAEEVARGNLTRAVPRVEGSIEVAVLGESVERMREALSHTIAELEKERTGLEERVEERTAELSSTLEELKETQAALVQGERLASIGELVAGVAHEIYNPLNAIAGSSTSLEQLVKDVRKMLDAYHAAERHLPPERQAALAQLRATIELDASLDDLVGISTVIKRATERSVRIVQNLKNFSRSSVESVPSDIHSAIEETLLLLAPRLRQSCIQVTKQFGALPEVTCRMGEINQVLMNLLMNSIQALEVSAPSSDPPRNAEPDEKEIWVETWVEDDMAVFCVRDNGPGVPEALQTRIFDPFFTTKPRGQGTGLGLSISTDIARRHGGGLTISQGVGGGARFVCRLPIKGPESRPSRSSNRGPRTSSRSGKPTNPRQNEPRSR